MHLNYKSGHLNIKVVSAVLERDTEVMGKMDPYVTLTYTTANGSKDKLKTKIAEDAGKTPEWNDEFNL